MADVILLLAGKGERLSQDINKQYFKIKGQELYLYSLKSLLDIPQIERIFLIVDKEHLKMVELQTKSFKKPIYIIEGGESRQDSVFKGLSFLNSIDHSPYVLIHDSVRPLIEKDLILKIISELLNHEAVVPFLSIYDSLAIKNSNGNIEHYLDRKNYIRIQTPQGFLFEVIYKAHLENRKNGTTTSYDDYSLLLKSGVKVKLIDGDPRSFKITTKEDLLLFKEIING